MVDPYRSGRYAEENPDWHDADAPHKALTLAEIARYAALSPRSVADVGCGTGRVLWELKRALDEDWPETIYEGWDIATAPLTRARGRYEGQRIDFFEGDFLASERRVDLVLCVDVIEHIVDDLAFLSALRSRADWFLFRIPLDLSALDVLRPARMLSARRRYGHRHLYSKEIALSLLSEAGYRPEVVRYDRVPPPRETIRQRSVDAARRAAAYTLGDRAVRALGGFSLVVCARAAQMPQTPILG